MAVLFKHVQYNDMSKLYINGTLFRTKINASVPVCDIYRLLLISVR